MPKQAARWLTLWILSADLYAAELARWEAGGMARGLTLVEEGETR